MQYRPECLRVSARLVSNLLSHQALQITTEIMILNFQQHIQCVSTIYRTYVLRVILLANLVLHREGFAFIQSLNYRTVVLRVVPVFVLTITKCLLMLLPRNVAIKIAATTQTPPICFSKCKNWPSLLWRQLRAPRKLPRS